MNKNRRKEIIKGFFDAGKTSYEIAKILNVSQRTVERDEQKLRIEGKIGYRKDFLQLERPHSKDFKKVFYDTNVKFISMLRDELSKTEPYELIKISTKKKSDTLIVQLSDWHVGRIAKDEDGNIVYDFNTFKERVDKFATELLKLVDKYISKGVPIKNVAIVSTGDLCVKPDTLILTQEGLKPISEITTKDYILTHKNRWQKVKQIIAREVNEEINKISTNTGFEELSLTKNHPVWSLKKYHNMLKLVNQQPSWVYADKLEQKDLVFSLKCEETFKPINTITLTKKSKYDTIGQTNLQNLEVDESFLQIIGLFLGDGTAKVNTKRGTLTFYFNSSGRKDKKAKVILQNWCKKYKLNLLEYPSSISKMNTLVINYKPLAEFFRRFYNQNKEKVIPREWLNIPFAQLKYILKGLILADGCIERRTQGSRIRLSNTSKSLLLSIKLRLELQGIYVTINKNKSKESKSGWGNRQKDYFDMNFCNKTNKWIFELFNMSTAQNSSQNNYQLFDYNVKYLLKKSTEHYQGKVYNLEVENDNSYIANGIIVHNCDGQGIFASQETVSELSPPFQVVETVKVIQKLILSFVKRKLTVGFYGVKGNHGELRFQGKAKDPNANWDLMVYLMLDFWARNIFKNDNISIHYSERDYINFNIRGWRFHARHIAPKQSETAAGKAKFLGWARKHSCDCIMCGHVHHWGTWDKSKIIIIRGGALTADEDDLAESMAEESDVVQLAFGCNENHLPTFIYPIDLGKKEKLLK